MIQKICLDYQHIISVTLRIMAEMEVIICHSTNQLEMITDTSSHYSMTSMFDTQLDSLAEKYRDSWSPELEMNLQSCKMFLYGMTFTLPGPETEGEVPFLMYSDTILYKGVSAAQTFISTMTRLYEDVTPGLDRTDNPPGLLNFLPRSAFISLFMAASFLFKFMSSGEEAEDSDRGSAVSKICEAHKIYSHFPTSRDHVKGATHIEILAGAVRTGEARALHHDDLFIKDRLGTSLLFDTYFRSTLYRNRNAENGLIKPTKNWKMMNDEVLLPPLPKEVAELAVANGKTGHSMVSNGNGQHTDDTIEGVDHDTAWLWAPWETYLEDYNLGTEDLA